MRKGFPPNPATKLPVPRVTSADSPEALALLRDGKPFVCKIDDWPARTWTIESLQGRIGHVPRRLERTADGTHVMMPMSEVLGMMESDPGWKASYLPLEVGTSPILLAEGSPFEDLLADVRLPRFVPKEHAVRVMVRNSRSTNTDDWYETPCHYEATAQPAIYVQLLGRKHLWLFAPDQARYLGVESFFAEPPFLSNGADACSAPDKYPEIANATCYEIVLEPGDLIYWPEFWFHWFVHYHDLQVNLRVDWNVDRLDLNSATASWAFANAVAESLGGFASVAAQFAALPPQTRELLTTIEQALIKNTALLAPGAMVDARTRSMAVDQTKYAAPPPAADGSKPT